MPTYQRPNFERIKRNVSIRAVCEMLGLELKLKGGQLRGKCPCCDHPSKRAFTVTESMGRFWCFGFCRSGGDCIELYARVKKLSTYDAACELCDYFKPS